MQPSLATQLDEVWGRLDLVMDPELDEPVTDMGFIEAVSIVGPTTGHDSSTVEIAFRLPTYWCSPNFAFLMAEGIKTSVEALPWVGQAVVTLHDHMAADEMNTVVNRKGVFSEVFAELMPDENLDALREKFDQKAFQRRQEVVIKALITKGYSPEVIVAMPLAEFMAITFDDPGDDRQRIRYTALLRSKGLAAHLAFPTYQGTPIGVDFQAYMGLLRSVRINMEFSGSLCRGLKRSRYHEADTSGPVPVLVDYAPLIRPAHACR
ncbi:MAG: iron-sulfur cluster assembly protein [Paracoccaceae bacterium]